jgi:hypothetical protein
VPRVNKLNGCVSWALNFISALFATSLQICTTDEILQDEDKVAKQNTYKILIRNPEGKMSLGRHKRRCKDS